MSVRTVLAVAGVAIAAAIGLPTAAQATPSSFSLLCDSGNSMIRCVATNVSGGVAPYHIKWFINSSYNVGFDDKSVISFHCTLGTFINIRADVSDATGGAISQTAGQGCKKIFT